MSKLDAILLILCVFLTTAIIGGFAGYNVSGWSTNLTESMPEEEGSLGFVGSAVGFLWDIFTFDIEGVPVFVSAIYDILAILGLVVIAMMIRGN